MALTNTQRQARYQKRLKERASLDGLGLQARLAVDRALKAAWAFYSRSLHKTGQWGSIDGIKTFADFRASHTHLPDSLLEMCQALMQHPDELLASEVAAFASIVETYRALRLDAERQIAPVKRNAKAAD